MNTLALRFQDEAQDVAKVGAEKAFLVNFRFFLMNFTLFSMNCTFFSWLSHCFMNFTSFHDFFLCIRTRTGISDRIWRISCSLARVSRICHVFVHWFMKYMLFSINSMFFFVPARGFELPTKGNVQTHFREDLYQYCQSRRLWNGCPRTPSPTILNGKFKVVSDNPSRAKNN